MMGFAPGGGWFGSLTRERMWAGLDPVKRAVVDVGHAARTEVRTGSGPVVRAVYPCGGRSGNVHAQPGIPGPGRVLFSPTTYAVLCTQ